MAREGCASRAVMVSATPLPRAAGAMIHWGRSGVCRDAGPPTCSGPGQRSSFQAMGQPATGDRVFCKSIGQALGAYGLSRF